MSETDELASRAVAVLRANDLGTMITAAPQLYPHMWSWDAAFITVGLAKISVSRAITEMRTLLRAQWSTGMIPHIVFSAAEGYFPGPSTWGTDAAAMPPGVRTSGICQPPVHAIAVQRILDEGRRLGGDQRRIAEEFVTSTLDSWLGWHRWLATARDPDRRGLIEIYHGWESGMDNSPRWDGPYSRVVPEPDAPLVVRRDLAYVADGAERPTDEEYRRYLWLVEQLRRVGYDDAAAREAVAFRVTDVFASAMLAVTSDLLSEVGKELGRRDAVEELGEIAQRFRAGVFASVSPVTGLARDRDVRADCWLDVPTISGFAPLICGSGDAEQADVVRRQRELFWGGQWCGHPELTFPLPPSVSPAAPLVRPRTYWRGPVWPVISWLFGWAFERHGAADDAARLRAASLDQLGGGEFSEYYEPFTNEPLGGREQSWTAAVTVDWLLG